jgi:hypothetical protein
MYTQQEVNAFLIELKSRSLLPRHIEFSQVGKTAIVNVFDDAGDGFITNQVFTGVSQVPQVALMKAIVENIERKVHVQDITKESNKWKRVHRSDGTAAFPFLGNKCLAVETARHNALTEAIERFVWATWWDDHNAIASVESVNHDNLDMIPSLDCLECISNITPLRQLLLIKPKIANSQFEVMILFAQLKTGGWISGGAAGLAGDTPNTIFRGMSEMIRHALAYNRMTTAQFNWSSLEFYEQRLFFFACGNGNSLVEQRLKNHGMSEIYLPSILLDEQLKHADEDLVAVHRILFEGQPPFVGGHLARLCL